MNKARTLALLVGVVAAALLVLRMAGERTPPVSPVVQVPTSWSSAREAPMHMLHVGSEKIACDDCHTRADVAPTEAACAKCHEPEVEAHHSGGAESPTTCLTCHAFGVHPSPSCADCHAKTRRAPGAPALEHHANATLSCGACHRAHGQERVVLADCTLCHADIGVEHGRFEARSTAVADGLDASLTPSLDASVIALARASGASFAGFSLRPHEAGAARSLEPTSARPGEICTSCHTPHASKQAARASCEPCHVAQSTADAPAARAPILAELATTAARVTPRGPKVAGHDACVTCHEPHRARKQSVRACTDCHADHRAAMSSEGHQTCTSCHAPHAPSEARSSCTTGCHATITVLASTRVPAHADCSSCHDAHQPSAAPGRACVGCHQTVKPSHPAVSTAAGSEPCVGCHTPHGTRSTGGLRTMPASPHAAEAIAAPCTSCHDGARNDHALHAGKTACTSCHTPHAFRLAGLGKGLCATCHERESKATGARPGHADCAGCHGNAHAPTAKPTCDGCHAAQAKTAPKGHATCTNCHEAHSGSLGTRASCTSCHTDKSKAPHASVGQGCATCHRPHGPSGPERPPACSSCHTRPSLAGLHAVDAHANCSSCHGAHSPPSSDRATCTGGCHADRRDHQPEAAVCKGCHLFRR